MKRPLALEEYFHSTSIRHRYDHIIRLSGLNAMIAYPVIVHRVQTSVLYVAHSQPTSFGGKIFDLIAAEVRELEQEMSARSAVDSAHGVSRQGVSMQSLAELYGELRAIANRVDDSAVRADLQNAAGRLFTTHSSAALLTPREIDVISLAALGYSNARIADSLGLTLHTVKGYMKGVMRKLGAETRFEAVFSARHRGIIP